MTKEKFTANLPNSKVDLKTFQSAVGLRECKNRPKTFDIVIEGNYNAHQLGKLSVYLQHLVQSMETVKLN